MKFIAGFADTFAAVTIRVVLSGEERGKTTLSPFLCYVLVSVNWFLSFTFSKASC